MPAARPGLPPSKSNGCTAKGSKRVVKLRMKCFIGCSGTTGSGFIRH